MIKVFSATDKDFTSNGDVVIQPLRAKVHKEDNGDYYLDLVTGLEFASYMVSGNIVVANTPQGDQAFRIGNVIKNRNKLEIKAFHVFYDSYNYVIADSYVVNKNGQNALRHLNNATEPSSPFSMASDVTTVDSYRCVRESLYNAIMTVVERWGGHLERDNFSIRLLTTLGQDNGVTVRYRKNLKEITVDEEWDDVCTKILPVGTDGILLNDLDPSKSIYITSSVQYDIPFTKSVSFDQDINEDDYPSETAYKQALIADLRLQATAYLREHAYPSVNYTLKANLEKVTDIGDTIHVIDERLGVNLLTNVISFDYDCILEKYTEIEFGNFRKTLGGLIGNITASVDKSISSQIITSYLELSDKPQIEGVTLAGNQTYEELNLSPISNTEMEELLN